MSAHADLVGFSRGMYSNWLWHKPLQLVVDAGEGLQLALGSSVFAPSWLAITHGHSDHVLGLPGFVAARRFGKGAQDKPLTIVHPIGSRGVQAVRDLLATAYGGVHFPITWCPVAPGASGADGQGPHAGTVRRCAHTGRAGARLPRGRDATTLEAGVRRTAAA